MQKIFLNGMKLLMYARVHNDKKNFTQRIIKFPLLLNEAKTLDSALHLGRGLDDFNFTIIQKIKYFFYLP